MKKRWTEIFGVIALLSLLAFVLVRERLQENRNRSLVAACADGDLQLVKQLLHSGARIDFQTSGTKFTPLHWAIFEEQYEVAKVLVENGADLTIKNVHGETVEDLLRKEKAPEASQLLAYLIQRRAP